MKKKFIGIGVLGILLINLIIYGLNIGNIYIVVNSFLFLIIISSWAVFLIGNETK
jgi:hypothetical protein